MARVPYEKVREKLMAKPGVAKAYADLEDEFAMIAKAVDARLAAGKTQAQVAADMGISQPAVAKIEAGKVKSLETLRRYAAAVGCKVKVEFVRAEGK